MNMKFLTAAIGAALCASGTSVYAFEAKVSGQVDRALMWADDSVQSELHHVDNQMSTTRFRFTGSEDVVPEVKAGVTLEFEYVSNSSQAVTQGNKTSDPGLKERILEAYFSGNFGKVSIGQGSGAADSGTEVDLSGTNVVQSVAVADLGGALTFMTSAGAAGPSILSTINQQDFESRYDRLRYDTPAFGPVKLAISNGTKADTINEAALTFASEYGEGGKLAGAIGYSKEDTNPTTSAASFKGSEKTFGGSISWLAPFGLNVTTAYSNVKDEATTPRDSKLKYVKLGYKFGDHAVAVDYAKGEDFAAVGDESTVVGVGYVYQIGKWAEFYTGAKVHSLDRPGASFEDIKIVTVGTRLKF
ncbi:MAG: porin [Gammaproteobacteria bacterium]|nr:porin [Gammaproteobacteria bacterium]